MTSVLLDFAIGLTLVVSAPGWAYNTTGDEVKAAQQLGRQTAPAATAPNFLLPSNGGGSGSGKSVPESLYSRGKKV